MTKLPLGLLATAAFLSSAGARIVDPLLSPIAKDFGHVVPELWVLIAGFTVPYGLAQLVLGPVGDRFGKLRVMLGSLVLYAVFTGACALAGGLTSLTVLRGLAGAASAGLIPVGMAYIGDLVPYAERQVTLSKFLTGIVLAQVLAGPVGGVFGQYVGWRGVFVVLAVLAVLAAVAMAWRLQGLPDRRSPGRMFRPELYAAMAASPFDRALLLAAMLDGALFVGCFPFIAPYLHEHYGLSYAAAGLVLACFGLGSLIYTRLAGRMVARLGEAGLVLAGGATMAGGTLLIAITHRWEVFIAVELMLGLGFFMLHGVLQARATELLPAARSTAMATFACVLFLGQSVGALFMSAAIARFDYPVAFVLDGAGILALALWLGHVLRRHAHALSD